MKSFLFLVFGLSAIGVTFAKVLNEKTSFRPPTAVQMRRLKSKVMFLPLRENQNEKINRIMQLMHLMELACFKKFAEPVNFKNRFGYRRPFNALKPLRLAAVRNDGSSFDHLTFYPGNQNRSPSHNKKYFGDSRIIFVPSLEKITENSRNINQSKVKNIPPSDFRRMFLGQTLREKNNRNEEIKSRNKKIIKILEKQGNFARNRETPQSNFLRNSSSETQKEFENTNFNKENIKYIKIIPPNDDKIREKLIKVHDKVFEENPEISETEYEKPIKYSNEMNSTRETKFENSSHPFFSQSKQNQIQQYEVEEIIEEKVSIDLKDNKDSHFEALPFSKKTIEGETLKQNNETDINDLISNSINSVLKSLINSMIENATTTEKIKKTFPNEKFKTWLFENNSLTSLPPRFSRTFSNQRPENFLKKIDENNSSFKSERQTKPLKTTPSYEEKFHDWRYKTTEYYTKFTPALQPVFKFTPTTFVEYDKYDQTTDAELITEHYSTRHSTEDTEETEKNDKPTEIRENLQQKISTDSEIETSSGSFEHTLTPGHAVSTDMLSYTYLSTDITTNQPNILGSSTSSAPQEIQKSLEPTFTTDNEYSATFSSILEIPNTESQELGLDKSTVTDKPETIEIYAEGMNTTLTEQNVKHSSDMTLSEIERTTLYYQELTDTPVTFDLNSNMTKDEEKENRQIHFEQDLTENTIVERISKLENEEQRRSDILITENFNDYDDINNNLSLLNYLERVKQNDLNLTTNSIFPFIPVVITDLREKKIPQEDLSILSKVFGKYWTTLTAMANSPNLDMLPLLKINKEEDLKNVLQNFYQEYLETTTTTDSPDNRKENNYESYDYLEEYKNLYEDLLESENEKNEKKRKRYRLKRDGEEQSQEMKATREYFENIEDEKSQENNFIHEDILYGEISQDEDANVLELRLKTADVNINVKNVTSQGRNKIF